jgi:long-chain acyl-CoA synthetase
MALQKAVAERWEEITGKPVLEGYGLTESSPVITFNPLAGPAAIRSACRCPQPMSPASIPAASRWRKGEAGELAARGPQVMLGYWNRPEETEKTIRDGWLLTGDIATMDADGYFRIVDRKKDMVVWSRASTSIPTRSRIALRRIQALSNPP